MDKLEFFKLFVAKESSENFLIPRGVMDEIMEGKEHDSAVLVGPNGAKQAVVIANLNSNWFFTKGWKDFVVDNLIEDKDVMLFTYAGHMKFDVHIYVPRKSAECLARNDYPVSRSISLEGLGDKTTERPKRVKVSSCENPVVRPHVVTAREQCVADSFSSDLPFIIRTLVWAGRKFPVMNISPSFLQTHGLTLQRGQYVVLRNSADRYWGVKVNECKGNFYFGKGFSLFLIDNRCSYGDILVCEVIDRSSMEMRVHVYR